MSQRPKNNKEIKDREEIDLHDVDLNSPSSPKLSPSESSPKVSENISEWLESVGCNLDEYMENIKVLENKGSSSDSVILFGDLIMNKKKTPVAFKIVFNAIDSWFDNSLVVEQQIYTNVTENMINNFHTPHLTSCIGVVKLCDTHELKSTLSDDQQKSFGKAMQSVDDAKYDISKASMLILGKSSGKTLMEYIMGDDLTVDDRFNILFQIEYTLKCFEKVGLTHNDLHMKNIFIDELEEPQERIYYISEDEWVKIKVRYDTKIYDFDRGAIYHPSVDRNFTLDAIYCKPYDQCNKFLPKRDLSSVLMSVFAFHGDNTVRHYIMSCVSDEFLVKSMSRKWKHLNAFEKYGDFFAGPEITDEQLKSISVCIEKLLKCPEFIHTKGKGKSSGVIYTLPYPIKITTWNPTSNNSHKSINQPFDSNSASNYVTDEYISSISINIFIKKDNIYEKEFGIEYITNSRKTLFKEFIRRKNVSKELHLLYMFACYVLSIPFVYKFDSNALLMFLYRDTLLNYDKYTEKIVSYVDDIWNTFNSTLPITMIKI